MHTYVTYLRYAVDPSWVITSHGHGMDLARAQTIMTIMLTPYDVTREDVIFLFFKTITSWERERYLAWAYQYRQTAAQEATDGENGSEVCSCSMCFVAATTAKLLPNNRCTAALLLILLPYCCTL